MPNIMNNLGSVKNILATDDYIDRSLYLEDGTVLVEVLTEKQVRTLVIQQLDRVIEAVRDEDVDADEMVARIDRFREAARFYRNYTKIKGAKKS